MTNAALQLDARSQTRRRIRGSAWLLMRDGSYVPVRLFDISESGVCVIAQVNLQKNIDCQLMTSVLLVPPAPTVLKQQVEVRYNVYSYNDGGFRTGLYFKAIDKAIAEEIMQYVSLPMPVRYMR